MKSQLYGCSWCRYLSRKMIYIYQKLSSLIIYELTKYCGCIMYNCLFLKSIGSKIKRICYESGLPYPFRPPNSDVTSTTNSHVATKLGSNFIICLFLKLFHVLLTLVVKVAWMHDHHVLFFLRFAFEKKRKRKKNKNHCLISQAQLLSYH